jgi:hypothetical protein
VTVNKIAPVGVVFPTSATLTFGETLGDAVLSGDEEGEGTFSWWVGNEFEPTVEQSGNFTMTFTPNDAENYNTVMDDVEVTVNRAAQTAPDAPTLLSKTTTSITLNEIDGAEYKEGEEGDWQDSPIFEGLTPYTEYTFYARLIQTANHATSPISAASEIIRTDCEHDMVDVDVEQAATCVAEGVRNTKCEHGCGHTDTRDIPKLTGDECGDESSIRDNTKNNNGQGIIFVGGNIVKNKAEIAVADGTIMRVFVYDALGNAVFRRDAMPCVSNCSITWNLRNSAGRYVANGTYLVIVEARKKDGWIQTYSAKLGVKR